MSTILLNTSTKKTPFDIKLMFTEPLQFKSLKPKANQPVPLSISFFFTFYKAEYHDQQKLVLTCNNKQDMITAKKLLNIFSDDSFFTGKS